MLSSRANWDTASSVVCYGFVECVFGGDKAAMSTSNSSYEDIAMKIWNSDSISSRILDP